MSVKLKISGDGMSIDKDITLMQAGKIIAFIGSETENIGSTEQPVYPMAPLLEQPVDEPKRSVRELIDNANPKTHPQRITVFGHFLAQSSPNGFFTSDEIKEQYQLAREKSAGPHFNREIDKAIGAGWIEAVRGEKNTFFVTRKGEDAIGSAFSSPGKANNRTKTRSANSKIANVSEDDVSEGVRAIQPVVPNMEGFPNYHKLKTKGLKIMWLLVMSRSHDVDRLSSKELVYLTSKLRDKLALSDVSGHTKTAAKNGWLTKDNEGNYLILHDGEEHLKTLMNNDATD